MCLISAPLGNRCLVMGDVRLSLADILRGFFVESLLTASRTEVVRLSLIFRFISGCLGINVHAAYRIPVGFKYHDLSPLFIQAVYPANVV